MVLSIEKFSKQKQKAMKYLNPLFVFLLTIIYGCSSSNTGQVNTESMPGIGTYKFSMLDSNEAGLAEGRLKITDNKEYKIKGTYKFDTVYHKFPGYESMKGRFEGNINPSSKTLLIDTNPGTADDNVFFDLTIDKNTLTGTWYYSAFRLQNLKGKIALIKNNN